MGYYSGHKLSLINISTVFIFVKLILVEFFSQMKIIRYNSYQASSNIQGTVFS